MELHSGHKTLHHGHLGEEKHQMLNLNRRLETYLSRVKLLEEENAMLAKEIQALRRSGHGASTRRKGLEEELRQARLQVDAAWRDRVLTEMEVHKVAEELQTLDLQRQREAQAHLEAKKKLEQSRKELEEEQRAQVWLREKVAQLEDEMMLLVQTHQEDVAHMEATLSHSRASMPTTRAQRCHQIPNLQHLEQEISQRASRAWQEAAEAHRGQIDQLEESLNQARSRLAQVGQEKSQSLLRLQALEKELASAQDVRLHLEKTAAQQGDRHSQEVQQLQELLQELEEQREELGQQIQHVVLENRGLLQQKTALGLEVATYRALLDSESLRGDVPNQPRNITDAVFSPRGVKRNYQTQLSASRKTTSLSAVRGATGRGPATASATPVWSRKPVTLSETPKVSSKPAYDETKKSTTWEAPYPKILQDGAVENFRPQEVQEKVTYAEPLSPPNEQEPETTPGEEESEADWSNINVEQEVIKAVCSYQVESGLNIEPSVNDEVDQQQLDTTNFTPHQVGPTEEPCGFSDESDQDVPVEKPADKEDIQELHAPIDAWVEKEFTGKEEMSDSETEAVIEPNFDSRTSSPVSESEPEESLFNKDFSRDENILKEDAAEMRQEIKSSTIGMKEMDVEDKLYPDGEEMDTWDSVIERRVDLKTNDGVKQDEDKGQHAEPEEDISAREHEHEKRGNKQEFVTDVKQVDSNVASSVTDTQVEAADSLDQDHAPLSDEEEDEDSQNVSVSWRTEVESDSYAQENTLADTRPLIRYKSDETDANTQASHLDESESSEGEQEKKAMETGMWSEGKTKRFGTMEDLCEEVEVDEECNLGDNHPQHRDDVQDVTGSEKNMCVNEVMSREGYSDEESEEAAKPVVPKDVDYDEELETDRLVEQELENLATDSYKTHFTQQQQQLRQSPQGKTDKETQDEAEARVQQQLASFTEAVDQPYENIYSSEAPSVLMPQAEIQQKDQKQTDAPEKREEDEQNESMLTHADVTEDQSDFSDFFHKPDVEEINKSEYPKSELQVTAGQDTLQEVVAPTEVKEVVEASSEPQEQPSEDAADCEEFPDVPETAEWEILENQSEDFEIRDQKEERDDVPESADSFLHDDDEVLTQKEEPIEVSPDSAPDENDIFVVKESAELMTTNGKDNGLHDFFGSGVKNDFWASSLETGATYQPEDTCNEAAEQTNQNLGFTDNLVWGDSENMVNWNSRVEMKSSKALTAEKEEVQVHSEVKKVLSRNVAGEESVDSDGSDVEGESWSSGEERLYK